MYNLKFAGLVDIIKIDNLGCTALDPPALK
jgi:hypothetical protein